ncbi:MAG: ribosome assembly cofactor RimP [Bacteroidales bacterium]|nr:ribosome assembly cofactor RimP [Bacteroidales bacterium]
MYTREKILKLLEGILSSRKLFLVDVKIRKGNLIEIFIDSDSGVTIYECADVSRAIEALLDRDTEDFELRVSSPGLDQPFKTHRQLLKYIGSKIMVKQLDGSEITGKLEEADELHLLVKPDRVKKQDDGAILIPMVTVQYAKPYISF